MILEAIVIILIFLIFATAAYGGISGAPWYPTKKREVNRLLELAEIKKGERFYDLGCGDGRMVFAAAKKGAVVEGIEIALFPFFLAKIRRLFQKERENIKISYKNMWKVDLSDADVIYIFLLPESYERMRNKIEKEVKKGTRIIVSAWPMKKWIPIKEIKEKGRTSIYLYKT